MIKEKIQSVIDYLRKNPKDPYPSLRKTFGFLLILTGIAGLFLPILQGILFISIGYLIFTRKDWRTVIVRKYDKFLKKRSKKSLFPSIPK